MRALRDLSIRGKLFGGFGAVLAVTTILGVALLTELGSVDSRARAVTQDNLPSVVTIGKIYQAVNDYWASANENVNMIAPAQRAIQAASAAQDARTIGAQFDAYAPLASAGQDTTDYHRARAQWAAAQAATAPLLSPKVRAGAFVQALVARLDDHDFTPLQSLLGSWIALNERSGTVDAGRIASTYSSARTLGIVLLIVALLIGAGIAFVVSRSIKQRIDVVLTRITSIAEHCMTYLREGIAAFADGDLTRRYEPVTPPIHNPAADEIGQVARALNGIRDDIVETLGTYNRTAASLSETIGHVSQTAGTVSSASQMMVTTSEEAGRASGEIARAITDVASGAERSTRMIEDARLAADEVARAISESAEQAAATAERANEARAIAERGVEAAEQATEAMCSVQESSEQVTGVIGELAGKSEQIGAIVETITGIAAQTNLLALNAAIEAARAGEQGRGFAVVAEEVRKLAEESEGAASQIAQLIAAIQTETANAVSVVKDGATRTQDGTAVVSQTRQAFEQIGESVADMSARIESIAAAAHQIEASAQSMQASVAEVAAAAEQSAASTEEVSASTEQTAASAQQIAASAQELSGTAEELNRLVSTFRTSAA
jgi:methyl-accepting chemotaxis protein